MKATLKQAGSNIEIESKAGAAVFWLSISLLVVVPLAFSTFVYRSFAVPKFALLLAGSAILIPLLILAQSKSASHKLKTRHVLLVCLYLVVISISTALGTAPLASLFGSAENQMGLITRLCFLVCFFAVIVGTGASEARYQKALRAVSLTGLFVAAYAFAQFFGRDLFQSPEQYTFNSAAGQIRRVASTLGHANYLGNFLLYTTPLSAGLALVSRGGARSLALISALLSVAAVVMSGTRGAWVGLAVGAIAFLLLRSRA